MIEIGGSYKIDTDKYQFILHTKTLGKDKDGNDKDQWNKTYHANIRQCCNAIADERLRFCVTRGILAELEVSVEKLCAAVKATNSKG